jgi:hypothetical protein
MAEYKLGRIRFVWKNNWTTGTTYVKDDIVRYGGKTYACVVGHVADADFYTDLDNIPARWNQVSDGSEWKGDWTTSTYYKVNDLVKYGGRVYLCNEGHESNASANSGTSPDITAGLEADFTKWDLYAASLDWKGDWATSTRYKINDVVRYGGISYVCNTGHQSSATATSDSDGLEADLSKWDQYATGFSWIGDWSANYRYKKNDVVLYGGTTYVCNTGHKSAASASLGLEDDQGLWDYFHKGIEFLGDWSPSTVRYKVNDIVKFGSDLWICVTPHTSSSTFAEVNWSLFVNGLEYENSWTNVGIYQPGDVVSYGGYAYISKTNNTNVIPTSSTSDWDLFTTGFSFQGDWTTATEYKVGQVVRLNGYTYVALVDHVAGPSNIPPAGVYWSRLNSGIKWAATGQSFTNVGGTNVLGTGSGATFDVSLLNTKYEVIVHAGSAGINYSTGDIIKITGDLLGGITPANDLLLTVTASGGAVQSVSPAGFSVTWASGTAYVLGDSVAFGVNTYICTQAHVGATLNRPDNDTTGSYWNLLAVGSITSILTTQGDTLYYGGAGPTRLPIGTDGQVLRVVGEKPTWTYFGVINNVVYVANSGADVTGNGQGLTIDKPWKSVRFAAKQIEDGYLNPNATELLRKNKQFIIKEAKNYVSQTFKVIVSAANATDFLTTDTSGIYVNMPIVFTGTVGSVVAGTTYYVHSITANTSFKVSNTLGGGARSLSAGAGSMTGTFVFSEASTERDTGIMVDAVAFDLSHSGTLQTTTTALAYFNAAGNDYVAGVNDYDIPAFTGTLEYVKTLIENVVSNTAPAVNYQDLNGVLLANQAIQIVDLSLVAEENASTITSNLVDIVITGLEAGTTSAIPAVVNPGTTISVKTGTYNEVLPIVVPRNTAIVGDELRSSVVQPAPANTNLVNDKPKTISVLNRIKNIIPDLVLNNPITPTSGNTETQQYLSNIVGNTGSTSAVASVLKSAGTVAEIVANGIGSLPDFEYTEYTGYNTSILIGYGDAKDQLLLNKTFIINEITEWIADQVAGSIAPFTGSFTYNTASCEADVGYIIDALIYDLTYGGNYQTRIAANAYFSNGAGVYGAGEKDEVIAAYNHLADVVGYVITENTSWTKSTALVQNTGGTAGSAESSTFAQARIDEIIATITSGGTSPSVLAYPAYTFSSDLQNAFNALIAAKSEIQSDTVAWVNKFYQSMNFNSALCSRDAGLIVEAIAYDVLFGTNFNSIKAGMAYHRATAQEVLNTQLAAEIGAINFIAQKAKRIAAYGSAAQAVETINDIIETIAGVITITVTDTVVGGNIIVSSTTGIYAGLPVKFAGSLGMIVANQQYWIHSIIDATTIRITNTYGGNAMTNVDATGSITGTVGGNVETCGTNEYNNVLATINGAEILRINKSFLSNEATAWVNASFGGTVTNTTSGTNEFTTSSAHNLTVGDPVKFTGGSLFGNVTSGTTYYVLTTPSLVTFTLTPIQGSSTVFEVITASGSMTVSYSFDEVACKRDMAAYIDALIYDINYLGNYKSIRAATLYNHAITGSQLSDMFYLRNGTGLRNMTLNGLNGVLGTANAYGTQRPTAGAYASLDPGYGPTDSNVWITPRSPYVQNVTTFGTGCVGCKIDGALHSAGNRSIVSNDFTQVLSDGIGVWCTGSNALTELVSVFSYYNYAGYLAELGGKIRATNGNNSYGTYGSLAEGVDTYEVPITATVNNRYYEAQVGLVVTDGVDTVSRLEFTNAGSNYNSATFSVSGTGYNVEVDAYTPEFRDGGVFESRILSSGADHASIANVAQGGSATSITIAATDSAISAAYVGMRIIITSGTGSGQTGYFLTYNSGTKSGTIGKESFTPLAIQSTSSVTFTVADATTLYENMRVQLVGTLLTGMSGVAVGTNYYVVNIVGNTFSLSTGVGGTAITVGTGSGGGPLELHAVGWDHIIPGTSIVSALDLTTAYIIEPRVKFTSPAYTATEGTIVAGSYFNLVYGDTIKTYNGAGSVGVSATGGTGANATFTIVRTGVSYAVTSNNPGTGYSYGDVLTILGTSLGGTAPANNLTITVNDVNASTGAIQNFTYTGTGIGGYFVALPENGTSTAISTTGSSFVSGGSRTNNVFWNVMAYGAGRWVAISAGNICEYTDDPTSAWITGGNMPSSGGWSGLTYGRGVFVAVRSSSTSTAYSTNGASWTAGGTLPASGAWTGLAYGNGVYVTVNSGTNQAASSSDNGVTWVSRTLPATLGWVSVTFGKGLFVAVATGSSAFAYSKDGINWTLSTNNGLGTASWQKVVYGAGVFCATASSSNIITTSDDGINWKQRSLTTTFNWYQVAYGNPNSSPVWVVLSSANTSVTNYLNLGCTAQGRVKVTNGEISEFRVVEPGSSYPSAPTIQIIDPNQTSSATWQVRSSNGVLASPNFVNRGLQYATAIATVEGNGYADQYQTGYFINVAGLLEQPTPGSNIQIALNGNYYKLVQVTNYLGTQGNGAGGSSPYTARFQISPDLVAGNAPAHGTGITLRLKYSQVRLTGHDFLSIGTGNVTTTNYPNTPLQLPDPSKETVGNGGGRVFYTSTDQDGNFRVGTLFSVEQATGVASINADAFNLAGLNSLTLGSVALGGTGATITQFSTDQYFTANSDNIVPTQKAIKAYIASQIGGGSSALNVNTLTAGVIYIAGNSISTTTGVQINVSATMNFTGGINGLPVAMDFLLLG